MLIITTTPTSINLIISSMPRGFDWLHLFWPVVSQVVLCLDSQVNVTDHYNK